MLHWLFQMFRHSLAVSAPAIWNNVPAAILDSVSSSTFKTAFKAHLLNYVSTYHPTDSDNLDVSYSLCDICCQTKHSMCKVDRLCGVHVGVYVILLNVCCTVCSTVSTGRYL